MKGTTAYAMVWISTALAVSVAIATTGKVGALWAMVIPMMVSYKE